MTLVVYMEHMKQGSVKRGYDEISITTKPAYSGDFGSPVYVDSEYSSAPKRKCMSLNSDGFSIRREVFCLPRLSSFERRSLRARFTGELERTREFERKQAQLLNPLVVDKAARLSWAAAINKKDGIVGHNGSQVRRGPKGKFESAKGPRQVAQDTTEVISVASAMKQCETLLKKLMSQKLAILYFNTPVDVVQWNIPDYFDIVKHPMDLGTVLSKMRMGQYANPYVFAEDVRLTFSNAMIYNPRGNLAHSAADTLSKMFEAKWKLLDKKFSASDAFRWEIGADRIADLQQTGQRMPPYTDGGVVSTDLIKPKMTSEEMLKLGEQLEAVEAELPSHILSFLQKCSSSIEENGDTYLEIDIKAFSDDEKFELKRLLDEFIMEKHKVQQAKSDPLELEALNVSGVSNPSLQTQRGPEPIEEDVDICGMDPPLSSISPRMDDRKIQPSTQCRSGSRGSDSDSDSDGSSASESQDGMADPNKNRKENGKSDLPVDQEKSDVISSFDASRQFNVDLQEHETQSRPALSEGENAKPERQVSPEKLYRAALLRSRFADTILKAHEKMHTQGENSDPDKLRHEREVLEKMQQEDRARLSAEARAAEEARVQAELEAKKQRELEREAARKALQQMEKTVEINDYQTLKDMLRSAAPAEISSAVEETVPDLSIDCMAGFPPGNSNALAQFGLFMRADEEEDEDEPGLALPASNDAEEGELD